MPKMKTNRTAYRKFRVGGTGTVKRGQAFTSHNTAKRGAKRRRRLRARLVVDKTNIAQVRAQLPNS